MAIGSVFREAKPSAPPVLIASFFTLAGPISPFAPPVVSPVPLRRRAEAAARAGFRGIGFTTTDLEYTLRDHPYGEIRRILADNGLDHVEIEFIGDWLSTPGENPAAHRDRNFIIASAAEIGAVHVKAGTAGPEIPLEVMIERFAALCDEARAAGAGVAIEFSPIGRIADLPTARALALGAGRERGGLLLDIWHLTRMGVNFADLAELPREIIVHVELSDGPLALVGDYWQDTISNRVTCGEGEFDVAGFLGAIAATGYDGPYGVELLSDRFREMDTDQMARLAVGTTLAHFTRQPVS